MEERQFEGKQAARMYWVRLLVKKSDYFCTISEFQVTEFISSYYSSLSSSLKSVEKQESVDGI